MKTISFASALLDDGGLYILAFFCSAFVAGAVAHLAALVCRRRSSGRRC